MIPNKPHEVRSGDPITAVLWNKMVAWLRQNTILPSADSGLDIQQTRDGTIIRVRVKGDRYLAIANGVISERSGTTPGTGVVNIVNYDGTNLSNESEDIPVLNASSTTMTSGDGIDDGQYCWIEQDPGGWWWVSPMECA